MRDTLGETMDSLPFSWDYFTDFSKTNYLKIYQEETTRLNELIGIEKNKFERHLKRLIEGYPSMVGLLLMMGAIRKEKIKKLTIQSKYGTSKKYELLYGTQPKVDEILAYVEESGLKTFLVEAQIQDTFSYLKGIEIGMDSNARKNRSGKLMEITCEAEIQAFCEQHHLTYHRQSTLKRYGITETMGRKRAKTFDFIIETPMGLVVMEVNNYNSEGSKLEALATDYYDLAQRLKPQGILFVWVANGSIWEKKQSLIQQNLEQLEHFTNLYCLKKGYLTQFLKPVQQKECK